MMLIKRILIVLFSRLDKKGFKSFDQVVDHSLDAVITMIPDMNSLEQFYSGRDSPISKCKESALIIDCSTIGPLNARKMSETLKKDKLTFVDAPVSGGVNGANLATLSFMIGSESEEVFEETRSILEGMGKNFFNCKGVGNGQAVKVCNNLALGIQMRSIAEAMNLARKIGLDQKILSDVMTKSTGKFVNKLLEFAPL